MNIRLRVANLIRKYDTSDPYRLAKELGITVMTLDLPDSVRGFLVRVLRRKYIAINASLPEISQKVVLCHELGHASLHPAYGYYYTLTGTYFIKSLKEAEANEFAVYMLSHSYDITPDTIATILKNRQQEPKTVHKILNELLTFQ